MTTITIYALIGCDALWVLATLLWMRQAREWRRACDSWREIADGQAKVAARCAEACKHYESLLAQIYAAQESGDVVEIERVKQVTKYTTTSGFTGFTSTQISDRVH